MKSAGLEASIESRKLKLKKAMDEGLVSEKLVEIVREKLTEIIENLHADKH